MTQYIGKYQCLLDAFEIEQDVCDFDAAVNNPDVRTIIQPGVQIIDIKGKNINRRWID